MKQGTLLSLCNQTRVRLMKMKRTNKKRNVQMKTNTLLTLCDQTRVRIIEMNGMK